MWFVLDNALVLPEYLVEFEYITNIKSPTESKKTDSIEVLNEETNKLFFAVNGAQRVLENTYIKHA